MTKFDDSLILDIADDPCESNSCSIYAECIRDSDAPNKYTCLCKVGFDGDGYSCYDVDECVEGMHDCDVNAECYNLVGHFECSCLSPYVGNGKECAYDAFCQRCDKNAHCTEASGTAQKSCECNVGYKGDGFSCEPDQAECLVI